jgi:hypothetical protein
MEADEPPPVPEDSLNLEAFVHHDTQTVLRKVTKEDREKGIIGFANPATIQNTMKWPRPILVRTRREGAKTGREYSTIDLGELVSPTKLRGPTRTLLKSDGTSYEDPRMVMIEDKIFITLIHYNGNAFPELFTTGSDFKRVVRKGPIGPRISLERAIQLAPERYQENLCRQKRFYEERNELFVEPPVPYVKDCCLDKLDNRWILTLRLEPDMQVAVAEDWKHFQEDSYWEEWISKIKDNVALYAEPGQAKVGWGAPWAKINGGLVALYHEVYESGDKLVYIGNIGKINPETLKVQSRFKERWLLPSGELFVLRENEPGSEKETIKEVYFPSAVYQDPREPRTTWLVSGWGDSTIGTRSTYTDWYVKELNAPFNDINSGNENAGRRAG